MLTICADSFGHELALEEICDKWILSLRVVVPPFITLLIIWLSWEIKFLILRLGGHTISISTQRVNHKSEELLWVLLSVSWESAVVLAHCVFECLNIGSGCRSGLRLFNQICVCFSHTTSGVRFSIECFLIFITLEIFIHAWSGEETLENRVHEACVPNIREPTDWRRICLGEGSTLLQCGRFGCQRGAHISSFKWTMITQLRLLQLFLRFSIQVRIRWVFPLSICWFNRPLTQCTGEPWSYGCGTCFMRLCGFFLVQILVSSIWQNWCVLNFWSNCFLKSIQRATLVNVFFPTFNELWLVSIASTDCRDRLRLLFMIKPVWIMSISTLQLITHFIIRTNCGSPFTPWEYISLG